MSESIDTKKIKKLHDVGLKGVLSIVFKHRTFKKFPFIISIILSVGFCILIAFQKENKSFEVLQITSALITTVFPALLGFSLGGYAIAVGFSNTDLIKNSTETTKHSV